MYQLIPAQQAAEKLICGGPVFTYLNNILVSNGKALVHCFNVINDKDIYLVMIAECAACGVGIFPPVS